MKSKKAWNKNKRYSKVSVLEKNKNIWITLPMIFVLSVLPFITRRHEYKIGLNQYAWFAKDEYFVDFYLYYKQLFFIITSSIMLLLLLYYIVRYKQYIKLNYALIALSVYAFFSLQSTIFSENSKFGFTGIFEQFESIFALLGYCVLVYYAFYFMRNIEQVEFIFKYLTYGILVMSILGITQITGHDFITSDIGLKLINPRIVWDYLDGITSVFGKKTVYLTLFNPNYVGVYTSLLIPIYIGLTITAKNRKDRILYICSIVGLAISLIGSGSEAGLIGLSIALVFIILFYRKYIFRKHWFTYIGVLLVCILGVYFGITKYNIVSELILPKKNEKNLTDIITDENVSLIYKGNKLKIDYVYVGEGSSAILLKDENDKFLDFTINDIGAFQVADEKFSGITVMNAYYNEQVYLKITVDGVDWYFTKQEDQTFYYLNKYGKLDKINTAGSVLFTGYEEYASGRGYIWSRTIPLLKKYFLLGSGADTFVLAFPQQDYVNLYNYGFGQQILTKPHNLYLQIGVQTGVISLIAFLVFYILYFIQSVKLYWKCAYINGIKVYGSAIFIGTISYMIMGIANDSSITVAPIFWMLMGIGISINYMIKENKE